MRCVVLGRGPASTQQVPWWPCQIPASATSLFGSLPAFSRLLSSPLDDSLAGQKTKVPVNTAGPCWAAEAGEEPDPCQGSRLWRARVGCIWLMRTNRSHRFSPVEGCCQPGRTSWDCLDKGARNWGLSAWLPQIPSFLKAPTLPRCLSDA